MLQGDEASEEHKVIQSNYPLGYTKRLPAKSPFGNQWSSMESWFISDLNADGNHPACQELQRMVTN